MTAVAHFVFVIGLFGQVFVAAPMLRVMPNGLPQAAQPTVKKPDATNWPRGAVFTIDNERFDGPVLALESGRLAIDSDPPRMVPFDEVERIELGSSSDPSIEWLGQDNHDAAQSGPAVGPNGIRDLHLRCHGLAAERNLTQVVVAASVGGAPQIWMLEPNNTPFWRLASQRAGQSETVDLYMEPPAADAFDARFDVTLTFDDGQSAKLQVRANSHTDASFKFAQAEGPAAEPPPAAGLVVLGRGESLHGQPASIENDKLRLAVWSGQQLDIPLSEVRGAWLAGPQHEERPKFDQRLAAAGDKDWVLIVGRDQAVAAVEGNISGLADGKLEVTVDGEARKVALPRVLGFVLAAHPQPAPSDTFYQLLEFDGGDKLSGSLTSISGQAIGLRTRWGGEVQIPRSSLRAVACRNGRATYLSDLEPLQVEETPYFSRLLSWHRDETLDGGPLVLAGTTYRKGLAVHSRSRLTYALDGRFKSFQAKLGFDDGAPPGGAVTARVLADDRELYANPDLRADAEPVALAHRRAGGQAIDPGNRLRRWPGCRRPDPVGWRSGVPIGREVGGNRGIKRQRAETMNRAVCYAALCFVAMLLAPPATNRQDSLRADEPAQVKPIPLRPALPRPVPVAPGQPTLVPAAVEPAADENAAAQKSEAKAPFELHHWGVWLADPALGQLNSKEHFSTALPLSVETARPRRVKGARRRRR